MQILFTPYIYLACLLACGGDTAQVRPNPLNPVNAKVCSDHPIVELIRAPLDVPLSPDPIVLSLDEAEIEEQDTDELSKPLLNSPTPFNLDAALIESPLFTSRSDRHYLGAVDVVVNLRC